MCDSAAALLCHDIRVLLVPALQWYRLPPLSLRSCLSTPLPSLPAHDVYSRHSPKARRFRGISYWQGVPATVDGVLGGYGEGTLPRVDALGSRTFLLSVLPRLSAVPPVTDDPRQWTKARIEAHTTPTRALDCGAGVGRVTRDVLSLLVDEVHLVEPVRKFLVEAANNAPSWPSLSRPPSKSPFKARKSAHFHVSTLHSIDPARPWSTSDDGIYAGGDERQRAKRAKTDVNGGEPSQSTTSSEQIPAVFAPADADADHGDAPDPSSSQETLRYDVVWCQWMLQHLSDPDLKSFFKRAKGSLVKSDGIIVVKENVCAEREDGTENVWWDEEDKSITRSSQAYERVFAEAGLSIVRCEVQEGLPEELFVVKMWALR